MKLFIPSCGTTLKLANDWTFVLITEYRNSGAIEYFGHKYEYSWRDKSRSRFNVTLKKDTVLTVDRVYIRASNSQAKGDDDYDSITFRAQVKNEKGKDKDKSIRFWVKLADANNIEYTDPGKREPKVASNKYTAKKVLKELDDAQYAGGSADWVPTLRMFCSQWGSYTIRQRYFFNECTCKFKKLNDGTRERTYHNTRNRYPDFVVTTNEDDTEIIGFHALSNGW